MTKEPMLAWAQSADRWRVLEAAASLSARALAVRPSGGARSGLARAARGATPKTLIADSLLAWPWLRRYVARLGLTGLIVTDSRPGPKSRRPTPKRPDDRHWIGLAVIVTACSSTVLDLIRRRRSINLSTLLALSIVSFVITYAYVYWRNIGGMLGTR